MWNITSNKLSTVITMPEIAIKPYSKIIEKYIRYTKYTTALIKRFIKISSVKRLIHRETTVKSKLRTVKKSLYQMTLLKQQKKKE